MTKTEALRYIASALIGIGKDDLTVAEKEIVKVLIDLKLVQYSGDDEVVRRST